ncbi:tyrosine-type recombinase/integrase [Corynebacterium lubricantis]|uniref:tyrosine-type recombinase/integrase n=1 Tax=Corynebacterium lubricantis TaxID=541095 RepID=UPI0003780895|nr:tyrosine-type recombinase/integrase [Corynebacterium lubricantis]
MAKRSRRSWGKVAKKGKRYYAEYTGPDGARHTPGKSFPSKLDADGWLSAEKRLIDLDAWTPPVQRGQQERADLLTVGEWLDKFHDLLETGAKPLKPTTVQNYRDVTRKRITAPISPGDADPDVTFLYSMRLTTVTKNDIYRWWDAVQRNYDTPPTNQQAYKRLKAAYAEAARREMILVNPVEIKKAAAKIKPDEKYLPSDEELAKILHGMNDRYKAVTSLIFHHGLRIGEAIALEVRHVHVEYLPVPYMPRVTVTIEQDLARLTPKGEKTYMLLQPPKTEAGNREVPTMPTDVPYFLNHIARYVNGQTTTVRTVDGVKEVELFTTTSQGRVLMDTSYRSVLDRVKRAVGVSAEIDPHTGRNFIITMLAEQGATLKEIGTLLGQADVSVILETYLKVRGGRTTTLMDRVSQSLGKV